MSYIKITYNGKEYSSLVDATNVAIAEKTKALYMKKLMPLESEILKEGGKITFNFGNILNGEQASIQFNDFSEELIEKMKAAIKA